MRRSFKVRYVSTCLLDHEIGLARRISSFESMAAGRFTIALSSYRHHGYQRVLLVDPTANFSEIGG